jgi:hypothetical protein
VIATITKAFCVKFIKSFPLKVYSCFYADYRKNQVISTHKCQKTYFTCAYTVSQASVFMMEKNICLLAIYPIYLIVRHDHSNSRAFRSAPCSRMCRDFWQHRRLLSNHHELWGPIHIGVLLVTKRNNSRKFLGLISRFKHYKMEMSRKLGIWSLYSGGTYAPVLTVGRLYPRSLSSVSRETRPVMYQCFINKTANKFQQSRT